MEKWDPAKLEKEAANKRSGQAGMVQGFMGKRPGFDKLRDAALEKLKKDSKLKPLLMQEGELAPVLEEDLVTLQQQIHASKLFILPTENSDTSGLELLVNTMAQAGLPLASASDETELITQMATALCGDVASEEADSKSAAKPAALPNLVVVYKPNLGDSVFTENAPVTGESTVTPTTPAVGITAPRGNSLGIRRHGEPSLEAKQHLQQGMTYISLKDYSNALLEFGQAIDIEAKRRSCYAVAHMNRGIIHMMQKNLNRASTDLNKALECDPANPMTHYNLVALNSLQKQSDMALDALDRALEAGFKDCEAIRSDSDLNNIRKLPEFRKTLEKHGRYCL